MSRGARTEKPYPNVRPADKSLKKIEEDQGEADGIDTTASDGHILERHGGKREPQPERGANYFHYWNSSLAMSKVRNPAEGRLRTHLMKRHKVKDRGAGLRRFPSVDL